MNPLIAVLVCFSAVPVGIFLRFIDYGFNLRDSIHRTLVFPIEVSFLHVSAFIKIKNRDRTKAIKILLSPLFDLPNVIVGIADMHLTMQAKMRAICELLNEMNDKEKNQFIKELRKEGIIVKKRKVMKCKVENINDDMTIVKYLEKLGLSDNLAMLFKKDRRLTRYI